MTFPNFLFPNRWLKHFSSRFVPWVRNRKSDVIPYGEGQIWSPCQIHSSFRKEKYDTRTSRKISFLETSIYISFFLEWNFGLVFAHFLFFAHFSKMVIFRNLICCEIDSFSIKDKGVERTLHKLIEQKFLDFDHQCIYVQQIYSEAKLRFFAGG